MLTSSFFLLYSHWVLPSYHIIALSVRALNLFPLMAIIPLCFPKLPPVIVKEALTPFVSPIFDAALSSVLRAVSYVLAALAESTTSSVMSKMNVILFIIVCFAVILPYEIRS